ncbi:MAG TPA: PAS domain S-box protein, partial [Candidatus Coatesbacteria bacterium]|nr:PAS domain S-box protein [Candidatus Coatesbacteria bacterium]
MKPRLRLIILILALGLAAWTAGAAASLLLEGKPFARALLFEPSGLEVFYRLALWAALSALAWGVFKEKKGAEGRGERATPAKPASEKADAARLPDEPEVSDYSLIGLYRTTPDGRILAANPALVRMLGFRSFRELSRRNLEKKGYEPQEPRARFKELLEREGAVRGLESVWLKRDGTPLYVRESARAVRDDCGQTLYYEGTVEDISDRKRVEEELKQKELRYKGLVDSAGVGIATTDVLGRFTLVNAKLCEMLGYTADELLGTPFARYLHPDDKRLILKIFRDAWKYPDKKPRLEFRAIRKDGRTVHCFSCPTLTLFEDKIIRFSAIIVDITEMKTALEALRASEERYRTFTEEAQVGVYIYSEGRFLFVNPAMERITGYSKEELLDMDTKRLEVPDEHKTDEIREEIRQQEDPSVHHYTMHLVRKDGEVAFLEFKTHPIIIEGSKVTLGNCMDLTETKRSSERLKEVISEKELLLREIHHRIKNNLQIISSLLYLGSQDITEPRAAAAFRESQNRIKIMAHIHELLYRSKDTNSIYMPVYLADIASSIFSSYATFTNTVEYELSVDEIHLGIDSAIPLGLCVNELVSNAIEHAFDRGERGLVIISLAKGPDGRLTMRVADNGRGLPERLASGAGVRESKTLGLSLVNMMVEQLAGELKLGR